jgi:hypothetical protein
MLVRTAPVERLSEMLAAVEDEPAVWSAWKVIWAWTSNEFLGPCWCPDLGVRGDVEAGGPSMIRWVEMRMAL